MPGRTRSGSVNVVVGRSIRPSAAALAAESLLLSVTPKKAAALGKRKRAATTRSPSPTRSEPDHHSNSGVKKPRRSRSRTPSGVRASTAAPTTGAAANARILAALRARENILTPASHPRPSCQLFVWGNGDMGQFGLGTETVRIPRVSFFPRMVFLSFCWF